MLSPPFTIRTVPYNTYTMLVFFVSCCLMSFFSFLPSFSPILPPYSAHFRSHFVISHFMRKGFRTSKANAFFIKLLNSPLWSINLGFIMILLLFCFPHSCLLGARPTLLYFGKEREEKSDRRVWWLFVCVSFDFFFLFLVSTLSS